MVLFALIFTGVGAIFDAIIGAAVAVGGVTLGWVAVATIVIGFIAWAYIGKIQERGGWQYLTPQDHIDTLFWGTLDGLTWVSGTKFVKNLNLIARIAKGEKIVKEGMKANEVSKLVKLYYWGVKTGRIAEQTVNIGRIETIAVKTMSFMNHVQLAVGMWQMRFMIMNGINNIAMHDRQWDLEFMILAGLFLFGSYKFGSKLNPFKSSAYKESLLAKGFRALDIGEKEAAKYSMYTQLTAGLIAGLAVYYYADSQELPSYGGDVKLLTRESQDAGIMFHLYDFGRFAALSLAQNDSISFIPTWLPGIVVMGANMDFLALRHMVGTLFRPDIIKMGQPPSEFWSIQGFAYYFNPAYVYNFVAAAGQGMYLGSGINSSYVDYEGKALGYNTNYIRSMFYEYGVYRLDNYNGEWVG